MSYAEFCMLGRDEKNEFIRFLLAAKPNLLWECGLERWLFKHDNMVTSLEEYDNRCRAYETCSCDSQDQLRSYCPNCDRAYCVNHFRQMIVDLCCNETCRRATERSCRRCAKQCCEDCYKPICDGCCYDHINYLCANCIKQRRYGDF